jgi:hypothetical protein
MLLGIRYSFLKKADPWGRSRHIQWCWFAALEGRHSYRSATIGSTFAARRAGI